MPKHYTLGNLHIPIVVANPNIEYSHLTYDQVATLGRSIRLDRAESVRLVPGAMGQCYPNSLGLLSRDRSLIYCLGYAAGTQGRFGAHAWCKMGCSYIDCTPQAGHSLPSKYIVSHEFSLHDIFRYVKDVLRQDPEKGFWPPMISNDGRIILVS